MKNIHVAHLVVPQGVAALLGLQHQGEGRVGVDIGRRIGSIWTATLSWCAIGGSRVRWRGLLYGETKPKARGWIVQSSLQGTIVLACGEAIP